MTDKELLMLAAEIGKDLTGYLWVETPFYTGFQRRNIDPQSGFEEQTQEWNPLADNADAFRLMVDLSIGVDFNKDHLFINHVEPAGSKLYAKIRRGIVLAAAEMGESL